MTKQQKASWGYPVDISYACLKTKQVQAKIPKRD